MKSIDSFLHETDLEHNLRGGLLRMLESTDFSNRSIRSSAVRAVG